MADNPAGMAVERPVTVYLPHEEAAGTSSLPVLYCLAPWTSAGRQQFDWQAFKESLWDRLDRLISKELMKPSIVVCPDLYTAFGGSQYINSSYLGRHADYIVDELIPYIENRYPVAKGAAHRGVFGRSSGGFGALRLAMDYPGRFAAIACHSGDMGFETAFRKDLPDLCQALFRYQGDVQRLLDDCWRAVKIGGREIHLLMLLGLAASYSPNLEKPEGFDLPVNWYDATIIDEVWQQWLDHDPVVRVKSKDEALRQLKLLYMDCGNRDQYFLHFGARQMHDKLEKMGIKHRYEEFDDNHSGTAYRYDVSLPLLAEAIS
ncbi:MAG: alpha/beta hydrolase [Oligoflexus sp.]